LYALTAIKTVIKMSHSRISFQLLLSTKRKKDPQEDPSSSGMGLK
jgi:hypothetical protein